MGYSEDLRARAASIWESEQSHPFVTGIGDGTLPMDRFKYYMCQDYVFLIDFCRAISLAVAKAPGLEEMGVVRQADPRDAQYRNGTPRQLLRRLRYH